MKSDWKSVKFELTLFRDSECYILKGVETIMDKLDEDLTKVMAIAASPYIKFLEAYTEFLEKMQKMIGR